jgi:hypothetical protein
LDNSIGQWERNVEFNALSSWGHLSVTKALERQDLKISTKANMGAVMVNKASHNLNPPPSISVTSSSTHPLLDAVILEFIYPQ